MRNSHKEFAKAVAYQVPWMLGAALLAPIAIALTPAALLLRNKCEKMSPAEQAQSKLPAIHSACATPLVFCTFSLIQGSQTLAASYQKAYKRKR